MSIFLISYDLGWPETSSDYKKLIDYLNNFNPSIKPLESFWLIKTYKDAETLNNDISSLIDINDKVVILELDKVKWKVIWLSESQVKYINNNF